MGSSWTKDRTHVSCIGRQILYHWAARETLVVVGGGVGGVCVLILHVQEQRSEISLCFLSFVLLAVRSTVMSARGAESSFKQQDFPSLRNSSLLPPAHPLQPWSLFLNLSPKSPLLLSSWWTLCGMFVMSCGGCCPNINSCIQERRGWFEEAGQPATVFSSTHWLMSANFLFWQEAKWGLLSSSWCNFF